MLHGLSLVEILIALAYATLLIPGVFLVAHGIPLSLQSTQVHRTAIHTAESALSAIITRSPSAFSATSIALVAPTLLAEDGVSLGARFSRIRVPWSTAAGAPQVVSLSSVTTDYTHATSYACSPFFHNIETHALSPVAVNHPLPPLSSLAGSRSYLVATAAHVPPESPSLFLLSSHPPQLEVYDTQTHPTGTGAGFRSAIIHDAAIYAITADSCAPTTPCASFSVFTIEDSALVLRTSIPIPPAKHIAAYGSYIFIGLQSNPHHPELLVFKMSVNEGPKLIDSVELGHSVHDVVADGEYVYVATADNSTAGRGALMAFAQSAIGNSLTPLYTTALPGAGIAQKIGLGHHRLILGRTAPLHSKELYVFSPPFIEDIRGAADSAQSVVGLLARGTNLLVLNRLNLEHWDLSDPTHMIQIPNTLSLPPATQAVALTCAGRHIFVAANTAQDGIIFSLTSL